jgi:LysM repeat protein
MVAVVRGDNLTKIAAAYNTTWQRIYDANPNISDPNIIDPGDQLRIPTADEQLTKRDLPQAATTAAVTSTATTTARVAAQTSYPTSDNAAKAFIYARESGNNPNATNPNGCYGLGQDCNGVLRTMCGADYACQDAYFTRYAMARYGSWAGALAFWQSHHWW